MRITATGEEVASGSEPNPTTGHIGGDQLGFSSAPLLQFSEQNLALEIAGVEAIAQEVIGLGIDFDTMLAQISILTDPIGPLKRACCVSHRKQESTVSVLKVKNLAAEGQPDMPTARLTFVRVDIDVVEKGSPRRLSTETR